MLNEYINLELVKVPKYMVLEIAVINIRKWKN